jgi:serine/threonine protein phosphatase 1
MRWIIGDIHGMLRSLRTLLDAVREQDPSPRLIFAGDYVNRGPDARGVIDLLLTLPNAFFIRGNHDDVFDEILHGEYYADNATRGDRAAAFTWFMKYGVDQTFLSYGADFNYLQRLAACPTPDGLDRLAAWVPTTHRQFIRNLPASYEEDDFFVVHGKWDIDESDHAPSIAERLADRPHYRHRLLWGRYTEEELYTPKSWGRTGYFGHTPVSNYLAAHREPALAHAGRSGHGAVRSSPLMVPVVGTQMVLLDTAAALGTDGRLTAYCVDDGSHVQADHYGRLVN